MVIQQHQDTLTTPTGPMFCRLFRPQAEGRFPAIIFYSERNDGIVGAFLVFHQVEILAFADAVNDGFVPNGNDFHDALFRNLVEQPFHL